MAQIARWTTPSIYFKPSAVDFSTIAKIFITIKYNDREIIRKGIEEASVSSGRFMWTLTQQETSKLIDKTNVMIQIDYICHDESRYTTNPRKYTVTNSAVNEEI